MSKLQEFDQTFYDEHIWGAVEISSARKGIDTLKLERLIEAIPDWHGKTCLEVGCGAGRYLRALERMLPANSAHLVGTDISTGSIDIAKRIPSKVEYQLMGTDHIPWDDQSFDVVCFLDVLEHIEDPAPFLAESIRVLKVGGVLHMSVPLEGDTRSLWRWFDIIRLHDYTKRTDGQIQRFTRKSLKKLAAQLPLKLTQENYSYQFIGNVLDLTLFTTLAARRALGFQGSHYDIIQSSRRKNDSFISSLSTLAETSMYLEGRLFGHVPGPNAHFTYRRLA
jgi:ubiquinone/menaquinone biosynthesis C-methylase UbiE